MFSEPWAQLGRIIVASLISVDMSQFTAAENGTEQDQCAQPSKYTLNHPLDSENAILVFHW